MKKDENIYRSSRIWWDDIELRGRGRSLANWKGCSGVYGGFEIVCGWEAWHVCYGWGREGFEVRLLIACSNSEFDIDPVTEKKTIN
jgi:hypothetical protein